jgi:hypothetical protein
MESHLNRPLRPKADSTAAPPVMPSNDQAQRQRQAGVAFANAKGMRSTLSVCSALLGGMDIDYFTL